MKNAFTRFVAALSLVGLLGCTPRDSNTTQPPVELSECVKVTGQTFFSNPSPNGPNGSYFSFSANFALDGSCPYASVQVRANVQVDKLHDEEVILHANKQFSLNRLSMNTRARRVTLTGYDQGIGWERGSSSSGYFTYDVSFGAEAASYSSPTQRVFFEDGLQ